MYTLRILIVILSITIYPLSTMLAQINVYTQGCNSITTAQYDNVSTFNAGCYELPNSNGQMYSTNTQKEVIAEDYILLENDVEFTASGSGQADLRIEELPYEVVAFTNSLDGIKKLDKFEIGLTLPEFYSEAVKNFISESGTPQINPFLSDQVEIIAEFSQITYDTTVYDMYPDPPEIVVTSSEIVKKRHAYFTKDVVRNLNDFDEFTNHPYWQSSDKFTGQDYDSLGGGWTESYSDYPFRIRFAPPNVGEWTCKIRFNLMQGTTVFEAPSFTFNVVQSNIPGYLKTGRNGRWLKRDGATYVPNGPNAPFVVRKGYPLYPNDGVNQGLAYLPEYIAQTAPIAAYEQYLRNIDTMAQNGANYFRMIMNPWGLDIEYEKLGDYSDRMHIASEMDLILERAQNNGMLIHWNLMLHNNLQTNAFSINQWDWSFDAAPGSDGSTPTNGYCYNDELGLSNPIDFFDDTVALKYYKERIRYIVARWGYSPTVGMFEHLSEVNQVGTEYNANEAEIGGTNQYNNTANKQKIFLWHAMMSNYMKDELEIPQLLTLSYTDKYDAQNDLSYNINDIDVISMNNYNYSTSDVHGFYRSKIPNKIADEASNNNSNFWGNYNKPVIFSESGAHEVWGCDNFIETRRNIWQNMFYGIAGSFDWEIEQLREDMKDLSIYGRVKEFMDGVDLEGENWHSGIVREKNNGSLKYEPSYLDDCIREDETADVVYLRSGDKEKAFGVITNRRANYYTLGDGGCVEDSTIAAPPEGSPLRIYDTVVSGSGNNRLRLRNMKFGREYKIKYYSPYDQLNSIKEETKFGSKITLDFPEMDTLDIVLFEAFLMGDDFKSMSNDSTNRESIISELAEEKKDKVKIYPNPNDGDFVVLIESISAVKAIKITNNLGETVDERSRVEKENQYNKLNLNSGVYFIEIVFENEVVRKKIVIN